MKKLMLSSILFLSLIVIIISSCNKNDDIYNENKLKEKENMINYLKADENMDLAVLAKIFSIAIQEESFRNLIKLNAMNRFDNDYDILYSDLKDQTISSLNCTVKDHIFSSSQIYGNSLYPTITFTQSRLDSLFALYNNFQISVPVNCEQWNSSQYIPAITYIPFNYDEDLYNFIMAFSSLNDTIWFDLNVNPNIPVIVLGSCERVDQNGQLISLFENKQDNVSTILNENSYLKSLQGIPNAPNSLNADEGSAFQIILEWNDNANDEIGFKIERLITSNWTQITTTGSNINGYVDNNLTPAVKYKYRVRAYNASGNSNYSNISHSYASPRSPGNKEIIKKMKFSNLSVYEKWISGAPEIRVRVAWGDATTSNWVCLGDFVEPPSRNSIENNWYIWNHSIGRWYPDISEVIWTFHFTEEDPSGSEKEVSFNVSYETKTDENTTINVGATVSFEIGNRDDVITYKPVIWWNPLTDSYNNGNFQWVNDNLY